jgi:hypothetical protein
VKLMKKKLTRLHKLAPGLIKNLIFAGVLFEKYPNNLSPNPCILHSLNTPVSVQS